MSLIKRVSALKNNVELLKTAQDDFSETRLLQSRLDEITGTSASLSEQVERLRVFRKDGIELSVTPSSAEDAGRRLTKIQERFTKEHKAESLTKGKDWELTRKAVRETVNTINDDLLKGWEMFVSNAYSGDNPRDLNKNLAPIDSNKSAFARYKHAYEELEFLGKNIPDNKQAFDDVNNIATQLKAIHNEFNFDVSDAVKEFLTAVGDEGASLELFSDEVRNWLLDNDTFARYVIVTKR